MSRGHGMQVWLVCYDISDPKRLRRVYVTMRGYGEHWQYSVFLCRLSASRKVRLMSDLEDIIEPAEDQVLFAPLGPAGGRNERGIETLGRPSPYGAPGPVVL